MKEFIDEETQASVERLIEDNARCRHLKNWPEKDFARQVFMCLRPRTPPIPPFTHSIRVYSTIYSITQGRGGGES
jgi:hypothetical protein